MVLAPIPEDDPDPARQLERQTAVWLFTSFDSRMVSLRQLARELNSRGVPGPCYGRRPASQWNVPAVNGILSNPVYGGVQETGAVGKGAYHRLVNGEIQAVAPGTPVTYKAAGQTMRTKMEYGGLVSPELTERVRAKVRERAGKNTFARANGYALPGGILHCGHCGGRMYGAACRDL